MYIPILENQKYLLNLIQQQMCQGHHTSAQGLCQGEGNIQRSWVTWVESSRFWEGVKVVGWVSWLVGLGELVGWLVVVEWRSR